VIRRAAGECLRRVPLEKRLRLLGVRVGTLSPRSQAGGYAGPSQGELLLA
jgi:DNA polymerase-4